MQETIVFTGNLSSQVKVNTLESYNGTGLFMEKDNNISLELYNSVSQDKLLENIPAIVYTIILMLIGIPGNAIVCVVYRSWKASSSTKVFIFSLAVVDLINCIVTFPTEIAIMIRPLHFDLEPVCKISRFSTYLCNTAAALIMVVIAVDRYKRICTPGSTQMTASRARLLVVCMSVVSVIFTWPALILYGTNTFPVTATLNVFAKNCLVENRFVKTPFILTYFAFHCISTILISTIISILYIFVGISLFQRWKFRKHLKTTPTEMRLALMKQPVVQENSPETTGNDVLDTYEMTSVTSTSKLRRNHVNHTAQNGVRRMSTKKKNIKIEKTAFMLFLATMLYILSFVPYLGIAIHRSLHPEEWSSLSKGGEMAYQLFLRSYLMNAAVDPIIYAFCNELFRLEVKNRFSRAVCSS